MRLIAIAAVMTATLWSQSDLSELYSEAQRAQAAGDLVIAARRYEAIIRLQPHMAEAYANLGNLYYQQGEMARAKTTYERALQEKPRLAGPHFFLGVIAFGERDYRKALEHLRRAAAEQPSNPLIHAYLGYTQFGQGRYGDAASSLQDAAKLDQSNTDVLYHLSKSYAHLADQAFATLHSNFPGSVYTILVRAQLEDAKDDWTKAADQYRLAFQKLPSNKYLRDKVQYVSEKAAGKTPSPISSVPDALVDGSLRFKEQRLSGPPLRQQIEQLQAETKSRAVKAASETNDQLLYMQGEAFQALAYLVSMEVIELDEDSYRAHQLKAQMCEESNDEEGAIAEYREVLKRKPDLQNIHFSIGSLYWKDHRLNEAASELKLELATNPHHPEALYELGDIYLATDRKIDAEKCLIDAISLQPNSTESRFALEKIYTESGRYPEALDQLQAILRSHRELTTVHYRMALVYRKMGRQLDAQRELSLFNRSHANSDDSQIGSSTVK